MAPPTTIPAIVALSVEQERAMSFLDIEDDICDYCGNFFDVSGSHEIEIARENHWCGECREGRDAIWGHIDTAQIKVMRDNYQLRYDVNPINWNELYKPDSFGRSVQVPLSQDQIAAYRQQYENKELARILTQVLQDRGHE